MNGVASEIPIEIGVFFQDGNGHARPRKQITGHHPGRPTACDHAACLQSFNEAHCIKNHGLPVSAWGYGGQARTTQMRKWRPTSFFSTVLSLAWLQFNHGLHPDPISNENKRARRGATS